MNREIIRLFCFAVFLLVVVGVFWVGVIRYQLKATYGNPSETQAASAATKTNSDDGTLIHELNAQVDALKSLTERLRQLRQNEEVLSAQSKRDMAELNELVDELNVEADKLNAAVDRLVAEQSQESK